MPAGAVGGEGRGVALAPALTAAAFSCSFVWYNWNEQSVCIPPSSLTLLVFCSFFRFTCLRGCFCISGLIFAILGKPTAAPAVLGRTTRVAPVRRLPPPAAGEVRTRCY